MSLVRRFARLVAAARRPDRHLGDVAVLKMDLAGVAPADVHRAAFEAVPLPEPLTLDELRAMPAGSFGAAVAGFMDEHGLQPFTFSDALPAEVRERNRFGIRVAQTHDLIHVLCGFDTRWPGEMGVYAVQYAQHWGSSSTLTAWATWLIYPWLSGLKIGALREAWRRGVAMGEAAPLLPAQPLERWLAEPLDDVRQRLHLAGFGAVPAEEAA